MRAHQEGGGPVGCEQVAGLLPGFVGEELDAPEVAEVQAHLRGCAGCRREAAGYLQAGKALRRAALEVASHCEISFADEHAAIMARVAALETDAGRGDGGPWRWRVLLAAAALLLAAFGFWLASGRETETIWDRPARTPDAGVVQVLPYAGSPAVIVPAGIQESGSAESGIGPGMMGRGELREEVELLPAVHTQRVR